MFSYITIIMVVKFSLFAVYYNYGLRYMVETLEYVFFAVVANFVMNIFAH